MVDSKPTVYSTAVWRLHLKLTRNFLDIKMDDKDVKAVLRMCGLVEDSNDEASERQYSRDEVIPRLMNITLQCLGAIRQLVVEQEKVRVSKDCNDIDGTNRDDGKGISNDYCSSRKMQSSISLPLLSNDYS